MPRRRTNGQYWTAVEDEQLRIFFATGSTKLEKARAINAVLPVLRMAARIIKERYYNHYKNPDLIEDAIMHFLQYCDFDSTKGSYYSYASAVLKHYFYDKVVLNSKRTYTTNVMNLTDTGIDINESQYLENIYYEVPDFDEFDLKERQWKLQTIIDYLQKLLSRVENTIKTYSKRPSHFVRLLKYANFQRDYLLCTIEYFKLFYLEGTVGPESLSDWLKTNCKTLPPYQQLKQTQKIFGWASANKTDNKKTIKDLKLENKEISWFMDDYTPEYSPKTHAGKNSRRNKDVDNHSYF